MNLIVKGELQCKKREIPECWNCQSNGQTKSLVAIAPELCNVHTFDVVLKTPEDLYLVA